VKKTEVSFSVYQKGVNCQIRGPALIPVGGCSPHRLPLPRNAARPIPKERSSVSGVMDGDMSPTTAQKFSRSRFLYTAQPKALYGGGCPELSSCKDYVRNGSLDGNPVQMLIDTGCDRTLVS